MAGSEKGKDRGVEQNGEEWVGQGRGWRREGGEGKKEKGGPQEGTKGSGEGQASYSGSTGEAGWAVHCKWGYPSHLSF